MDKEEIIHYIKITTEENNGTPLGEQKFYECTPVKKSDWYGKIWLKWSDAVKEAGFTPNEFFSEAISIPKLIEDLADLMQELDKYPTEAEITFYHVNKKTLPSTTVIRKYLGRKKNIAQSVIDQLDGNSNYSRAVEICKEVVQNSKSKKEAKPKKGNFKLGKVYLMKSGKYYKIGKADHVGQRNYSIGIKLPEKLEVIHEISTDDPFGIEKYWHNRFKDKRLEGEWFDLSAEDVEAFKRRKKFM